MKPLHDSIRPEALKSIGPGDVVVLRMVNNEQCSGVIETVSPHHDAFTFAGRGFRIHAIEIARIESRIPAGSSS
ncbi:hypothetical protein [Ferviditalea candida]|uniref:Uncharacterized protein n=1 Tax=Ferviditalea candida TaxID=3108399 RepID=A0ABU5ZK18_9BACL|nr:hypothetical protein [Paenibacillaceae bacterium T2]